MPLVPDGVEFAVEAVVERVGPECGVLLPATALTDVRLLRPRCTRTRCRSSFTHGWPGSVIELLNVIGGIMRAFAQ